MTIGTVSGRFFVGTVGGPRPARGHVILDPVLVSSVHREPPSMLLRHSLRLRLDSEGYITDTKGNRKIAVSPSIYRVKFDIDIPRGERQPSEYSIKVEEGKITELPLHAPDHVPTGYVSVVDESTAVRAENAASRAEDAEANIIPTIREFVAQNAEELTGPEGPQGPKGEQGTGISLLVQPDGSTMRISLTDGTETDFTLPQGPQGVEGPQGPKGDAGERGPEGPKGDQGPQGVAGDVGPKGDTGDAGPQGEPGPKGDPGERGPQGVAGDAGPQGDTGDPGPQGPQGELGLTGEKGEQGERGDTGPSPEVSWSEDRLTVGGQTGPSLTGPQGDRGPQGDPGPKGDTGDPGPKGATGERGPQGDPGDPGPQGLQGDPGPKGDTGDPGPQGLQGDPGPQGPQGDPGPKGDPGERGPEGPQGPQGDPGPEGPKGDKGDTGPQGEPGPQGVQGERGPTGPAGPQGPKGDTGAPGALSSASSYVIVGPGRPDTPATTEGAITGSEPVGAEYRSTDGAGVGAYVWMKRPGGKWEVTDGDTGWRFVQDVLTWDPMWEVGGSVLVRRCNDIVTWEFTSHSPPDNPPGEPHPMADGYLVGDEWLPFQSVYFKFGEDLADGEGCGVWIQNQGLIVVVEFANPANVLRGQVSFPARDRSWPTTLPGTPA